jgi:hypothetical protein
MHPRNTRILVALAVGLFAFIYFFESRWDKPVVVDTRVLPGLKPAEVRSLKVQLAGQPAAIRAERTNGGWRLTDPLPYPAQPGLIDDLLKRLEGLKYERVITARDLRDKPKADQEYGFDSPWCVLSYEQGGETPLVVRIGKLTAPGDQVYLQVLGRPDVDIVDRDILTNLPAQASDWRDTTFVSLKGVDFDRLTVTNGAKVLELQRSAAIWRMKSPQPARADQRKIMDLLQNLQDLQVVKFEPDDDRANLETYGLQPPAWELAFFNGTNQLFALQFGKSPTNDDTQVFARYSGSKTIVQLKRALVDPWRAEHSQFRDPRLAGWIIKPLDAITVSGPGENFSLRQTNDTWRVISPSGNWPADAALTFEFIKALALLEVTNHDGLFANDSATELDLSRAGLKEPARKYVLSRSAAGIAGAPADQVVAELDFGVRTNDIIFARRGDMETNYVYAVKAADIDKLPATALALRDHRLWNFSSENVSEIDVGTNGRPTQYQRMNEHEWNLKLGSTGIWDTNMRFKIDAAADLFADLKVQNWVGWGDQARAQHGFSEKSPRIDIIFTDHTKVSLEFGGLSPGGLRYGATQLDGQSWVFEFAPDTLTSLVDWLSLRNYLSP